MPRDYSRLTTLTITKEYQEEIRQLGESLGIHGHKNVVRTVRHLVEIAKDRPDFFHVLNKRRRFPPIDDRYASL